MTADADSDEKPLALALHALPAGLSADDNLPHGSRRRHERHHRDPACPGRWSEATV